MDADAKEAAGGVHAAHGEVAGEVGKACVKLLAFIAVLPNPAAVSTGDELSFLVSDIVAVLKKLTIVAFVKSISTFMRGLELEMPRVPAGPDPKLSVALSKLKSQELPGGGLIKDIRLTSKVSPEAKTGLVGTEETLPSKMAVSLVPGVTFPLQLVFVVRLVPGPCHVIFAPSIRVRESVRAHRVKDIFFIRFF